MVVLVNKQCPGADIISNRAGSLSLCTGIAS